MDTIAFGDGFGLADHADAILFRADGSYSAPGIAVDLSGLVGSNLKIGGYFSDVRCIAPDGSVRWVDDAKNAFSNVALDDVLNVYLRNGTPKAAWYLGLVDNAGFTAFAAADTMASHSGWSESQDYAASTRGTWSPGASSGQSVTNSSSVNFVMNATKTIRGLFVNSANDKGGTTGTLLSTAAFTGGNQAVNSGDTLQVTYTVSATTS